MRMILIKAALTLLCLIATLWGAMAFYYQFPHPSARALVAGAWVVLGLSSSLALWGWPKPAMALFGSCFLLQLLWWHSITPRADRDWAPEVAQLATGHYSGDWATLDHVRNFNWRSLDDYDVRWERRQYDLSTLQSVDMLLSEWGIKGIAHVLVSFGFTNGDYLTFSVEIRKERDEKFSEYGGFFKQFEASIIAADERDIVQVRTNIRKETVGLYRVNLSPDARRALFIAYINHANQLARAPAFYNTLTANCTTVVYEMLQKIVGGIPLDYRLLLSAYLPEYLHRLGATAQGVGIIALREQGAINARAQAAAGADDFSAQIRRGVPGVD